MAMDPERLRMLEDEQQAQWLAEHGNPSPYEWPLIVMAAAGVTLILLAVAYTIAAWWVS
jgi:hypothetical protein